MSEPDPVAEMLAMHDTYRMEECEFLFALLRDLYKHWERMPDDQFGDCADSKFNRMLGVSYAMDILDTRIADLQERQ